MTDRVEKRCSKCREVLPLDAFGRNASRPDGLAHYCKPCMAALDRERQKRPEVKARKRESDRKRYPQKNEYQKVWKKKNAEHVKAYQRAYGLRTKYGLTPEQFDAMWAAQNGQCSICLVDLVEGPDTHVDHDHYTDKVRGLLCGTCNAGIGLLQDNVGIIRRAADYVQFWSVVHAEEVIDDAERVS